MRSSKVRLAGLVITGCFGAAQAADTATSAQLVDALNAIFGAQRQTRANHANGMVLTGSFQPSAEAARISRAVHFQSAPVPVTVRFSNFGGYAHVADADPGAAPYGMSVKFKLPDGSETDLVMHSFDGFPSRTADEFRDFLVATKNSPAGGPRPSALERFAATHDSARRFLAAPKPPPASFVSQPYFGVNTFKFINAAGEARFGRYRFVPVGATRHLDAARSARAASDYLRVELRERIKAAPVQMKLMLQLPESGDALLDPSIAWPAQRRLVELGTLSINAAETDNQAAERKLSFFPDDLPDGIEAHDPMLRSRTKAYAESIERRQH